MPRIRSPQPDAVEAATRALLEALGFDPRHPMLDQTPERVAKAWAALLQGYDAPTAAPRPPADGAEHIGPVELQTLPIHFVCPHHLLPATGELTVRYLVEGPEIPGFGEILRIIDRESAQLVLQEDLSQRIADALVSELPVGAAIARIRAHHGCLLVTDPARRDAQIVSEGRAGIAEALGSLVAPRNGTLPQSEG